MACYLFRICIVGFVLAAQAVAQSPALDSLRAAGANPSLPPEQRLEAVFLYAQTLRNQKPDLAQRITDSVLAVLPSTDLRNRTRFTLVGGQARLYQSDVAGARAKLIEARNLSRQQNDSLWEAIALHNLGNSYIYENQPIQALDYHQQAEHLYTLLRDTSRLTNIRINIASTYFNIGDDRLALQSYFRVYATLTERADSNGLLNVLSNIGNCYFSLQAFDSALYYHRQAFAISAREGGNDRLYATVALNLGSTFSLQGVADSGLYYFGEAGRVAAQIGEQMIVSSVRANMADLLFRTGKYAQARDSAALALSFARENNDFVTQRLVYMVFYKHDSVLGNLTSSC